MSKFENWGLFDKILNVQLSEKIKEQLNKYFDFLVSENQKYNLTSITDSEAVYQKHFLDSLFFSNNFLLKNQKICDIGTGAGFPGVVLKIFYPELEVHLVESNNKKIHFLNELIKILDLKNITTHYERAEDFCIKFREQFDVVISRAVSELNVLLELGSQLIKISGNFICLKGPRAEEEIKNLNNKEKELGLQFESKDLQNDDYLGTRINLVYKKISHTPKNYPRQYAQIKKKPLGK
ncbi:16S rRNA (guanine(527)-N(7))-methyltransferase RsmG [Spiroplasma alleghenense]|uniref:Ribosomal RNA small subunit methyltransferase G n=1 Tax=Spiroplasma alleghenense TaxID=216931 RepID=A0A345Z2S3_9MOLU|nr:16S rRNA (guanine(527)-N(7))-methyltransferase RsmG [Spiroplasma alleghenense]AXK50902.1 16S rRNA methyltransferase GidB [Spiroplasma alleghenense]